MEQTPLRYERRGVSNLSGSKEPPAGRPPTASPAQAGRGWKRGAAEGAGGCPCMGDAASVRRQSHQRLRIGLFCHRQKSRRERYVVRGDVVRAWGLEPQRITAREPKGDVTLVKSIVMKETYSNGIMELGTAHIPAALMKYVEKNTVPTVPSASTNIPASANTEVNTKMIGDVCRRNHNLDMMKLWLGLLKSGYICRLNSMFQVMRKLWLSPPSNESPCKPRSHQ